MKIFLSAVSAQFRDCRQALASDLRAVDCEVSVQEEFQQHGRTLLEKLQNYIEGCDRIIALIGNAYGAELEPTALKGLARRSYTQWEYYFAMGERLNGVRQSAKDIYVYMATADYLNEHSVSQEADKEKLQSDFLGAIKASGKDRNQFGSLHELCRLVLRDGFKIQERPPTLCNLPVSLGPSFKGRERELDELKRKFQDSGRAVKCHAICGTGGIGKSRLAIEYGRQHESQYRALLTVTADNPENLRSGLANLRVVLRLGTQTRRDAATSATGPGLVDAARQAPQESAPAGALPAGAQAGEIQGQAADGHQAEQGRADNLGRPTDNTEQKPSV